MSTELDAIEQALAEIERARKKIATGKSVQIRQVDLLDYLKSVSFSWFRTHRRKLERSAGSSELAAVDLHLQKVLDATSRASARTTYKEALGLARDALTLLRSGALLTAAESKFSDNSPDFSALASDAAMRDILTRRWNECQKCINADAHLAATVMMGGFLEALFVARANKLVDKKPLYTAQKAPLDPKTKKPLPLSEWTLRPYIDVGQELGWISRSSKDVAAVLRDYRNYIHPEKERSHGVSLDAHDSNMFWQLTKSIAQQLVASCEK